MRPFESYYLYGEDAFLGGKAEAENPYPEDTLAHLSWAEGYHGVQNTFREEQPDPFLAELRADETKAAARRHVRAMQNEIPTAPDASKIIGIDLEDWIGNCYAISAKVLDSGMLDVFQEKYGKLALAYGIYTGETTREFRGRPLRHGWLESVNGHVVDPTRWVFTGETPILWVGKIDDYDLGAMRLRQALTPVPLEPPTGERLQMGVNDSDIEKVISDLVRDPRVCSTGSICAKQLRWLMGRPLEELGINAKAIYKLGERLGVSAMIPADNRKWIEDFADDIDEMKSEKRKPTLVLNSMKRR